MMMKRFRSYSVRNRIITLCIALTTLFTAGPATAAEAPEAPRPAPQPSQQLPKIPDNYLLQPGDEVMVSLQSQRFKDLESAGIVSPDGMLYLKNVAPVKALGMTVPALEQHVNTELGKRLKRPNARVALVKLGKPIATPKVTVTGAVGKAGPVDLEAGLTVGKAIALAGGSLKDADLSKVVIVHNDRTRTTVDLSTPDRVSDSAHNRLLLENDSVEVPLSPNKITVVGAVGKPGPVDLEKGLRVRKAIELAGGTAKDADLTKVTIVHKNLMRTVVDVASDERISDPKSNLMLQDGDSIDVPLTYKPGYVSIAGGVVQAGSVELVGEMSLEELIVRARKLTQLADLTRVQIRRGGKTETINYNERKGQGLGGEVMLQAGDDVFIPEAKDIVFLVGAIPNPGAQPLKPGQTVRDFFLSGDAYNQRASTMPDNPASQNNPGAAAALDGTKVNLAKATIVRKEGSIPVNLKDVMAKKDSKFNIELQSGDMIYLPPKEPKDNRGISKYMGAIMPLYYLFSLF